MINTPQLDAYIDVRGPWPTLIHGGAAITLKGCHNRGITVEEAVEFVLNPPSSPREQVISTDLDLPFTTE